MANNHIPAGETIADRCWLSFLLLLVSYRKIGEKRNVMCASSHTRKRSVNPISVGKVINLHSNLISVVLVASGPGPGLRYNLLALCALLVLALVHIVCSTHQKNPITRLPLFIHACLFSIFSSCRCTEQHGGDPHTHSGVVLCFWLCEMMASTSSTSGLARLHRLALLLLLAVYLNVVSSQGKKRKTQPNNRPPLASA